MGHLRDKQLAEMDRALEVGDPGEGRRGRECVRGCVTAIGTGMGTSVCLHSDELVSERPLERAWQSPMTHSLLHLQDDTLGPSSSPCPLPPTSGSSGGCCCWLLSLSSPRTLPYPYCNSQETSVTQERVARLSITLLEMFHQVLVVNKHLSGSQPPSEFRA